MSYADEKLSRAVYLLATLPGGIHERLITVYIQEISCIEAERDVPEYLRDEFSLLLMRLTSQSPVVLGTDEGRVHATVRTMTQEEAVETARSVLSLAHQCEQFSSKVDKGNKVDNVDSASAKLSTSAITKKHMYSLSTFPFEILGETPSETPGETPDFFGSNEK